MNDFSYNQEDGEPSSQNPTPPSYYPEMSLLLEVLDLFIKILNDNPFEVNEESNKTKENLTNT